MEVQSMMIVAMLGSFLSMTQMPDLGRPSNSVREETNRQHHISQRPDAASLNILLVVLVQP